MNYLDSFLRRLSKLTLLSSMSSSLRNHLFHLGRSGNVSSGWCSRRFACNCWKSLYCFCTWESPSYHVVNSNRKRYHKLHNIFWRVFCLLEVNQASDCNHVIVLDFLGLVGRLIAGYAEVDACFGVLYLTVEQRNFTSIRNICLPFCQLQSLYWRHSYTPARSTQGDRLDVIQGPLRRAI